MTSERAVVSRVERKRGRRIQEILRTAAELFGERGYDGVNLEDVAERLDVTKGSLYYYFASKDELVTAAIETLGKEWTERLERLPEAQDGSAGHRLRALIREHVDIAVREYPVFCASTSFRATGRSRSAYGSRRSAGSTTRCSGGSSRRAWPVGSSPSRAWTRPSSACTRRCPRRPSGVPTRRARRSDAPSTNSRTA